MNNLELQKILVRAKSACYVGSGQSAPSSRQGSHDLTWTDGRWSYRDSYFGGSDFLGQETLWFDETPVWAMNYYGYILRDDLIDSSRAGSTIKAALSAMYAQGRFLGGFEWTGEFGTYRDGSIGEVNHFQGREVILVNDEVAYALDYFGGIIKP